MARLALAVALVAGSCTPAAPAARRVTPTTTTAPPSTVPPVTTTLAPTVVVPSSVAVPAPPPVPPPGPAEGHPSEGNAGAAAQTARVSFYGAESGSRTADGTAFTGAEMVFAHRSMAFGTMVRFEYQGRSVTARCADRGPAAWTGREFDLSRAVFEAIAPLSRGVISVEWAVA